jgi:uncharacterized protein YneF (UPF0154 family)
LIVRSRQTEPASRRIALVIWSAGVIAVTAGLNQLVFATIQSDTPFALVMFAVLLAVAPFLLGLVGGALIPMRQRWREAFWLAALGTGCFFVILDAFWNATPAACTEPTGCDIALGFGAALLAAGSYVAFLSGAVIGRFGARRLARRRVDDDEPLDDSA